MFIGIKFFLIICIIIYFFGIGILAIALYINNKRLNNKEINLKKAMQ